MKHTIFITGTDTGVGKTVFTALLAAYFRQEGVRVAALKPVCSGGRDDARKLRQASGGTLALDEINPWYYRAAVAPFLAAGQEGKRLKLAPVLSHIRQIRKRFETTLIEGAGGLLSPLGVGFDSRDLISGLLATPIIVAPNQLGVINHILLTLEALPNRLRARAGVVLMESANPDSAAPSNPELLTELSGRRAYRLPWLGKDFSLARALQDPRVYKTLAGVAGRRH